MRDDGSDDVAPLPLTNLARRPENVGRDALGLGLAQATHPRLRSVFMVGVWDRLECTTFRFSLANQMIRTVSEDKFKAPGSGSSV